MLRMPPFEVDFEKAESYSAFTQIPVGKSWKEHNLGLSSDGVNSVYSYTLGPERGPGVVIIGSLHGAHEWGCGHWLKWFMRYIDDPSLTPAHAMVLHRLRSRARLTIIPCCNPYGYETGASGNANGVNLNRNFDSDWEEADFGTPTFNKGPYPFSEPETQMVRDVVSQEKPLVFVDCHTWGTENTGVYLRMSENQERTMGALRSEIAQSVRVNTNQDVATAQSPSAPGPYSREWVSRQDSNNGLRTVSFVLEPGGGQPESVQGMLGITTLLAVLLHVLEWYHHSEGVRPSFDDLG